MASFHCETCSASFEADEAKCPNCLRRSSVRDVSAPAAEGVGAAAPSNTQSRQWVPLIFASVMILVCGTCLSGALLGLRRDAAFETDGHRVSATIVSTRGIFGNRTGGCEVSYQFAVDGRRIEGSDSFSVGCPVRPYGSIEVFYLPDAPSRSRAVEGHGGDLVFTQAGSVCLGLFLVLMLAVWGNLAFPRVRWLQRVNGFIGRVNGQRFDRSG
jgi:Protein of unknown function (DUF3592)